MLSRKFHETEFSIKKRKIVGVDILNIHKEILGIWTIEILVAIFKRKWPKNILLLSCNNFNWRLKTFDFRGKKFTVQEILDKLSARRLTQTLARILQRWASQRQETFANFLPLIYRRPENVNSSANHFLDEKCKIRESCALTVTGVPITAILKAFKAVTASLVKPFGPSDLPTSPTLNAKLDRKRIFVPGSLVPQQASLQ